MPIHFTGLVLFVQDTNRLHQFYRDFFNAELVGNASPDWTLLKIGSAEIGLHKSSPAFAGHNGNEHSNTKMVFDTDQDIFQLHQKFAAAAVQITSVMEWDNFPYRLFDGKDPEGNIFQVRVKK